MKSKFCIALFLICCCVFSQELPPIVKYAPFTYGAGNQNWMISQDENHYLFFANNEGLLEFNGSNWELYPSPNETILRSVKVIGNKIYTGSYMEFGYWTRQATGKLKYTSLSKTIKKNILDEEQFWNILNYDHWVIFQSLDRIYIYDSKTNQFKVIAPKNKITKSFSTKNSIYFQTISEGLFEIESGKARLVSNNPILKNNRIVNVFSTDEGLLIQTQLNGFYRLNGVNLSKFSTEADAEMMANSVYSSHLLSDGSYVIGTVSNGIFILTAKGGIKYHISQNKGLSNNTALSVFEDADKNLWVGLDNGINCINLQSPIKNFVDDTGILGTVYASKLYKGRLYIGTNQGLFYKDYLSSGEFKFINGTKGQVWSLFEYDGSLFCGHDSGTFIIENGAAKNIFSKSGTWKFETIPNQKGLLLQGNYFGISILEKVNNQWRFRNKIAGFDYSARYFEITDALEVYISHEYKGVFRLQLDNKLRKTKVFTAYEQPKKGKNAGLIKYNNTIYYAYKEGIFKLNNKSKLFEKDKVLSSVFEKDEYTSGKLIVDNSNKIWLFSKNYIHYFSLSKLSNQLKQNVIPIPTSLTNSMSGFENIEQISNYDYLIGTTDGYYTMNINDLSFNNYNVTISNIATNKLNEDFKNNSIREEGRFKYDENNIIFNYTVPEYNKYINAEYQYLLEGFQDEWSDWSTGTTVNFKNLPSGQYVFKVRTKFANSLIGNTASYAFTVLKPWYRTNIALFFYFLIGIVLARFIHKAYKNYYKKKEDKLIEENNLLLEIKELENEQQMMRVRNEQLLGDVDAKSRELAASTMNLHNKNELLAIIKEDLKKTNKDDNRAVKSVISIINNNITEKDSWSVFKEAFENTDKEFLKKVKAAHPLLTPSDLRLCAYLRLNLSSKEIAPLLNISVRSVEIKRYRLRKKMDLSHEQGLVEYILAV
ncbi:helix-turn-helix and ligand-binding sensor domain-containing protein [Flavobacterium degerlachei]|jgi:DNA-binding CsgD family transcriptional regulator/ligand-binding sensor domain-containing protein|uniref:Regulatory protein, luxR family n=1 Tax=Flavobacterium degerlachei TaxID=229203 RepID=A0A1H2T3Y6_9FLAO|nr:triple tyrosine motif-containing protein [Flavobacterium degerlachei]SDW38425.1 regulatory protein, luxR family [Flavobacterium degerlachei]